LQLCAGGDVSFSQVTGFLNSASLCGLLAHVPGAQASMAVRQTAPPERLSMIGRLRQKLGLS